MQDETGQKRKKPQRSCMDTALGMLSRRGFSVSDMHRKLQQKHYDEREIAAVMARLVEMNYLDDRTFALGRARYRAELSGWGPLKIRQELMQQGLAEADIQQALAALEEKTALDAEDKETSFYENQIQHLLGRRFQTEDMLDQAKREKALGFLMRRGFAYDQAKKAIAALQQEAKDNA